MLNRRSAVSMPAICFRKMKSPRPHIIPSVLTPYMRWKNDAGSNRNQEGKKRKNLLKKSHSVSFTSNYVTMSEYHDILYEFDVWWAEAILDPGRVVDVALGGKVWILSAGYPELTDFPGKLDCLIQNFRTSLDNPHTQSTGGTVSPLRLEDTLSSI